MATSETNTEQTVSTYRRATKANGQTLGREGHIVSIKGDLAEEVMVTADLHGNRLNFDRLVRLADLENNPHRHLIMQEVCHGGPAYPATSACMSHLLLEDVAALKANFGDRFHFILGNHELAELADFPITKANRMLNLTFRCGMQEMYGAAAERVREACLEFLSSCPLAARLDNGVFVCHSAPERVVEEGFDAEVFNRPLTDDDMAPHGAAFRLVWGRDFRARNAEAFARLTGATTLVHGHEPCSEGFKIPNDFQIILDCCGTRVTYLLLPNRGMLTHTQVAALIRQA